MKFTLYWWQYIQHCGRVLDVICILIPSLFFNYIIKLQFLKSSVIPSQVLAITYCDTEKERHHNLHEEWVLKKVNLFL
jgi:hypothetical protein